MSVVIAIDIGGTQIRAALYSIGESQPIYVQRISTYAPSSPVFDRLAQVIESVWPSGKTVDAISVAAPGPLEPRTGIIFSTPNIKEWVNFPLGEKLNTHFGVPVYVNNDANLAAVGEWRYGAGKGHHDLLYLTISTGIGGGVILNDHLLLGYRGLAAELGHVTVLPDGPLCSCGQRGHLEAVASGPGIANYVRERLAAGEKSAITLETATPKEIARAARQGDSLAKEAYEHAGRLLGRAAADFLHMFNPSIVIFGGGVSQSSDLFFEPMRETMVNSVMDPIYVKDLVIVTAQLGDDVGLLGALAQAEVMLAER